MKKCLYLFLTFALFFTGCDSLLHNNNGIFGKSSKNIQTQIAVIAKIDDAAATNSTKRLNEIGAWSSGVNYALDKDKSPSKEVDVAKQINERVTALANKPDFDREKEVKAIIDGLLSDIKTNQDKANQDLAKKDIEIEKLSKEVVAIKNAKDNEVNKALNMASHDAAKADQYKATLNDMDSFFGLGAVWYGLKKLFVSMLWFIIGFGVLFLLVRGFASTNPIAAAVFGIFENVISWCMSGLKTLAPNAHKIAGFVEGKISDGYKNTLTQIIDDIQMLKEKDTPNMKYTIDDLLGDLEKSLDSDDKARVDAIKKDLNWK